MKDLYKNLKFAWKYVRDEKWKLVKYVIANVLEVLISIIIPIISAKIAIILKYPD